MKRQINFKPSLRIYLKAASRHLTEAPEWKPRLAIAQEERTLSNGQLVKFPTGYNVEECRQDDANYQVRRFGNSRDVFKTSEIQGALVVGETVDSVVVLWDRTLWAVMRGGISVFNPETKKYNLAPVLWGSTPKDKR